MSNAQTTASLMLDALRKPEAKPERPKMSASSRANLRKLMAVLRKEIAANAATMTPEQKRNIPELARVLEAHLSML